MTFSIVAHDTRARAWGVAVQSKFLAAGSLVPWARAPLGALATQAMVNGRYGPLGLAMLEQGIQAGDVLAALVASDPDREIRQLGVVDRDGHAAGFTGAQCIPWAGHVVGDGWCCQGNTLAHEGVLRAMADAYVQHGGLPLPERLVATLEAGQAAGGDRRGQQSAGLLVVRPGGGLFGSGDRLVDLRVDDHATPIGELARLLALHRETFGPA